MINARLESTATILGLSLSIVFMYDEYYVPTVLEVRALNSNLEPESDIKPLLSKLVKDSIYQYIANEVTPQIVNCS